MSIRDLGILFLLAAMWGASFLFIRVAVPVLGPFALVDVRVLLAGLVLLGYAGLARRKVTFRGRWRQYLMLGLINAVVPFTLIATAELHLTASLAAMLNATTPLFGALVAAAWGQEPLTAKKLIGLVCGLVGVGVVVGWSPLPLTAIVLLSVGASLLAALAYALGGVYSKVTFGGTPALTLAIGQQLAAGLWLLPLAALAVPTAWPSPSVMLAVLALAIVGTAYGYILYFGLMERVGPTNTLSVTFLVPVFGLIWGRLFLHERIGIGQIGGLGIILASLTLVTGVRFRPGPARIAAPAPNIDRVA